MTTALVIGAGPAGLMAADVLSAAGHSVVVTEAKPSVARKFLMAGKSGLNLTKDQPFDAFLKHFNEAAPTLRPCLKAFGPKEVMAWAEGLGQEIFTGSTGRVFPKVMKASPLLRSWLARLDAQGVEIRTRWRWVGLEEGFVFETPEGVQTLLPQVCVLACGGASWARLGSDSRWVDALGEPIAPFKPANMGFRVNWSDHMRKHFGAPVKGVALKAGEQIGRGEFVLSERGIEGGGIYEVSRPLREGAPLSVDLVPDLSLDAVRARLARPRGKASLTNYLRKSLGLSPAKIALLMEFGKPLPADPSDLLKHLPVQHDGPGELDLAISTAGGVPFEALTKHFMLRSKPGIFVAGEMMDWEAPTGGYLLTGCLATGRWAGQGAVAWVSEQA